MRNLDRAFHLVKADESEQIEFINHIKKDFARTPTALTINCELPPLQVDDAGDRLAIKYFDFPFEILNFESLKELTIQSYYNDRIPDEISNLKNLEKLVINSGKYISSEQFPKFSPNDLHYDLGLKFIPSSINKLTKLKVLDISCKGPRHREHFLTLILSRRGPNTS